VLEYKILSPVVKVWFCIVIWFVTVLIPDESNDTGLMINLSLIESYLTLIANDVPIPTDRFGFTSKSTLSPDRSPWDVEIETVDLILSTSPFICG